VVRAFVGVTDRRWYEFLRARPELSEVNFWRPSGLGFRAISSGEPFLFKTHHPDNKLVGGGLLSDPVSLRLSEAWDIFGEANGVASLAELRAAIGHYRRAPLEVGEDPKIGCILLREVNFPDIPLEAPPDFAANVVTGKTYDLEKASGSYIEAALSQLLSVGYGRATCQVKSSVGRAWSRNGLDNGHSGRWCSPRTNGAARSPGRRFDLCFRRPISDRWKWMDRIESTTACFCGPMYTRCLIAVISVSDRTGAFTSVRVCDRNSTTARASTAVKESR